MFGYSVTECGVGEFGTIYSGVTGQDAIDFLIKLQQGEVRGAFRRSEFGEIDLIWGEKTKGSAEGHGLAHILEKHSEMIGAVASIINDGVVYRQTNERVLIIKNIDPSQRHIAAVRLDWNGLEKTWLVAAFNEV